MTHISPFASLLTFVEKKAHVKFYPFYLAFFLMCCSLFFSYPQIQFFDFQSHSWETTKLKSNDLTNSLTSADPTSNNAKKVFRLTVPLLMKLLHLSPLGIIILQCFLGFFIFVYGYKISLNILDDVVSATFITAGIAFLYFGRVAYFDINRTWFDTFAYFFLLMAIYSQTSLGIIIFSTLAAWTDERAFIALGIVFLFHHFKKKGYQKTSFKELVSFNKEGLAVIFSIFLYLIVRMALTLKYDMHTPSDTSNYTVLSKTLIFMPVGMWTFLEGFWLVYIFTLAHTFMNKNFLVFILFLLPLVIFTVISGCVLDITRSGSYLLPVIFVLIGYMKFYMDKNRLRKFLFYCFCISFLFPALFVMITENNFRIEPPTFIYALKHLLY